MLFFRSLMAMMLAASISLVTVREDKPLTPEQARKKIGKKITVEMTVKTVKDRLEKRGEVYLDAEQDFRDEKNFAVVITRKGAGSLNEKGVTDFEQHFQDKKIQASGEVKEVDKVPRIEIDEAKQIKVIEDK